MKYNKIHNIGCLEGLKKLKRESINCCVTSPPYWALRDYGVEGQLGLEPTFEEYITKLCDIFDEVKRVLKKTGTCWVNIGDTYMGNSSYSENGRQGYEQKTGMINKEKWIDPKYKAAGTSRLREHVKQTLKSKSLVGIPFRFALEMIKRGWILRNTIIWHKPNCMPSSVKDRFTVDFECVFFFVRSKKYYFEQLKEKIQAKVIERRQSKEKRQEYNKKGLTGVKRTMSRNKRSVFSVTTKPFKEAHFATYPEDLIEPMIKAGCPEKGVVLDPFMGAGTTALVALKQNKKFIGFELNKEYIDISMKRILPFLEQTKLKKFTEAKP